MIPDTLLGLLLFAGTIGPGYVWVRVAEQRRPREQRSNILEAAELAFVGILTTGLSALVVLSVADSWQGLGIDTRALAARGIDYLIEEPLPGLGTLLLVLGLSYGLAYGAARTRHQGPSAVRPGLHAWDVVFDVGNVETAVHATAELNDGRRFSGWVYAWDLGGDTERRDLALHKPISVKARGGQAQPLRDIHFITLRGEDIVWLSTTWFPQPVDWA